MADQSDYIGDGRTELPKSFVNGKLNVYRHFNLAGSNILEPTGIKPMGINHWKGEEEHYPYDNVFEAQCQDHSVKEEARHEAPQHDCKCGFYASYKPEVDFYEHYTGYRVFAAVEVFGRVIMGTKGVRAQKMSLRGMWVMPKLRMVEIEQMLDLRKVRKQSNWWKSEEAHLIYDAVTSGARLSALEDGQRFKLTVEGVDASLVRAASDAAFEDYYTALRRVGHVPQPLPSTEHLQKYGVPIYESREGLLAAFPPDDVSSLVKIEVEE